jgi:hypothetical protein
LGQTLFFADATYQDAGVPGLFLKPSILGFENTVLSSTTPTVFSHVPTLLKISTPPRPECQPFQ